MSDGIRARARARRSTGAAASPRPMAGRVVDLGRAPSSRATPCACGEEALLRRAGRGPRRLTAPVAVEHADLDLCRQDRGRAGCVVAERAQLVRPSRRHPRPARGCRGPLGRADGMRLELHRVRVVHVDGTERVDQRVHLVAATRFVELRCRERAVGDSSARNGSPRLLGDREPGELPDELLLPLDAVEVGGVLVRPAPTGRRRCTRVAGTARRPSARIAVERKAPGAQSCSARSSGRARRTGSTRDVADRVHDLLEALEVDLQVVVDVDVEVVTCSMSITACGPPVPYAALMRSRTRGPERPR